MEQGESIAAPPGGDVVWVGSEGVRSPVIAVRLPEPPPTRAPPTTTAPAPTGGDSTSTRESFRGVAEKVLVGSAVGLVLVVVLAVGLAWRRRG